MLLNIHMVVVIGEYQEIYMDSWILNFQQKGTTKILPPRSEAKVAMS